MERLKKNEDWSLLCPDSCKGLTEAYGEDFKKLYEEYESKPEFVKKVVKAQTIWKEIISAQMETGTPYLLYKDAANQKSNQKNLGTIRSSNLCVAPETLILTSNGHEKIEDLKDKDVNVWNGKEFSQTRVYQTNDSSELIDVYFSDGSVLTCTKYHKFYNSLIYKQSDS